MNLKQVTKMIISIMIVILLFLIFQVTFIQGITIIILIGLGVCIGLLTTASRELFPSKWEW